MNEDRYTEVEINSWGQRITNSFGGLILGVVLFLGSFIVLYWNEGRVDFSQVAEQAIEVSATSANNSVRGKFITTTGSIVSEELLGDNLFLNPGKYISINRTVEMFAWDERKTSKTQKNVGGSEKKVTTYDYSKEWTERPQDSSKFKKSAEHHNPPKSIADFTDRVSKATIGIYNLDMSKINLPPNRELKLNEQNVTLKDSAILVGDRLFKGNGTPDDPQIGDIRLEYSVIPNGMNVTVFGKLSENNTITTYLHEGKHRFYRLLAGSKQEAIYRLNQEHTTFTWIFRLLGLGMMWLGLSLFIEPISVILDFVPFLGNLSRSVIGVSAFIIAFCLSSITILFSMLLHNLIALLIAIFVAVAAGIVLRQLKHQS